LPAVRRGRLGLGLFLFGFGVSILTVGVVGELTLDILRRAFAGERFLVLAIVVGGLILAVGSAMVAYSFARDSG
jgi:hypothetical protein